MAGKLIKLDEDGIVVSVFQRDCLDKYRLDILSVSR
jgi:hypothetical protein